MSEYTKAKGNKLRLKGESNKPQKKKKRKRETKDTSTVEPVKQQKLEDTLAHGGWWAVSNCGEISGAVALEFGSQMYMKSLDDGTFTLGAPHRENEPPSPEEIFTAISINENKIAIKSGYGKYLKVEKNGEITGRSDAVGPTEQFEPIFEEGNMALLGYNGCFMSSKSDDDSIVCQNMKAGPSEFIRLRCQAQEQSETDDIPTEEKGNIRQIEINYVKKFQKFQDKRMLVNKESREGLRKAKDEGTLHEALLDRRAKMKSDRMCK